MPAPKKLLLVDDDPLVISVLVELFAKDDIHVTTAANGAEGLDKLKQSHFDLLITDVWMPKMTGLELLAEMRNLPEQPPVLVMTADDTPETMLKAVREQAHHFITKPFKNQEVEAVVKQMLEKPPPPIEVISAKPEWVELIVPCELRSADRIHGLLLKLKADLPAEMRESLSQAFRELLHNAIEWGGKLDPTRKVRISFQRFKRAIIYRIADPGEGFHIDKIQHAAVANPPDDPIGHMRVREEMGLRPGGLGIMITQSLVDELLYNEAHNEVVFIKYLD
jgi:CheY-like chemotaxis protein